MKKSILLSVLGFMITLSGYAQSKPAFRMLVLAETHEIHQPYVEAGHKWLDRLAKDNNFVIDYIEKPEPINDAFLANYQVFFQLNYTPYRWSDESKAAFVKYMEEGKGGWVGVHHASLLGEFDGYAMWPWFSEFMGGIRYKNYIATFVSADVNVEDSQHPIMKGVSPKFNVAKDEWYIWDKSPRPKVRVLASADEDSYKPDSKVKMGDHPVVWTNEKLKGRNVYIFMGHDPSMFSNKDYTTMLRNALFWAAEK